MPLPPSRLLPTLLACTVCAAPSAVASDFYRQETAMSAETCQAALPAYDGAIRKRPLALVNEGTASAFITCGFSSSDEGRLTGSLELYLVNTASGYRAVSCTLVDGPISSLRPRLYVVRALAVAPGTTTQRITWSAGDPDLQVDGFVAPALSCALEPGTGISLSARTSLEQY